MSKIYILIEELSTSHINFEYHIIGLYNDKHIAIDNAHSLYSHNILKNPRYAPSLKVLEYPINTPTNYIDTLSYNNYTVFELNVVD
jgi:hypothetical protein